MSAAAAERTRTAPPEPALVCDLDSSSDHPDLSGRDPDLSGRDPDPRLPERGSRRWPRAMASLEVRDYRLFLGSQVVSTTGLWMQRIAQDWLVLQLTGSATAVGIAVALQFAPVLLLGLVGGVIADRYPKRVLLIITQSSAALMALALGVLALTGAVEVWHVYVVAFLLGLVTVVDNPTRQVFVAELVGRDHIRNAVSLNSSVFQFGALLGPAISGVLIHAVGQGWSFLINGVSCLVVVGVLFAIRARPTPAAVGTPGEVRPRLRDGLTYIKHTSEIGWTIVLTATMGVLGLNMPVILAAFADQVFEVGVGGYSLFTSLTAVGAFSGAVLSARRQEVVRLRTLVASLTVLGGVLVLAASAQLIWLFAAALIGAGLMTLLFLTGANSLVQMRTAAHLRGRVMSVYVLVLLGGQAIGGPAVGWLIDHYGVRPSMLLCGGLIMLVALVCGVAMARGSDLRLQLDLHRDHSRVPLHIVHHAQH